MEKTALKYAPTHWDANAQGKAIRKEFLVDSQSIEFFHINDDVKKAVLSRKSCTSIVRNQNLHDYGQLLIREQLLCVSFKDKTFYRVRRYAVVLKEYLENALEYNFDYRRCGLTEVKLSKYVTDVLRNEVLLVMLVVTCDLESIHITPDSSSEYMIDYIVEVN